MMLSTVFSEYGALPLYSEDEEDDGEDLKGRRLKRSTFVGTALYISPEVLDRQEVSFT